MFTPVHRHLSLYSDIAPMIRPRLYIVFLVATTACAQNCAHTSTGFPPINDLGTGYWRGMQGGLYPNGSNMRPPAHDAAGRALASQVVPLDTFGMPSSYPPGNVVLLTIGMSNTLAESIPFVNMVTAMSARNGALTVVNGAQGGMELRATSDPTSSYWQYVSQRLKAAGCSDRQVQVIWLKQAVHTPPDTAFAASVTLFDTLFVKVLHILREKFPNLKLCYVSSRIYGGYATSTLNPEPHAYYTGWGVKNVIGRQIAGDTALTYDGPNPRAPWLAWGPYLWADGTTTRSDSLVWICPTDFQSDGTHPSSTGAPKVASMLVKFFTTDSTCIPWFRPPQSGVTESPVVSPSFTISPDPVHAGEDIVVSRLTRSEARVELVDMMGRVIAHNSSSSGHLRISTTTLTPGTYGVRAMGRTQLVRIVR
jgi:hypothetical protein